MTNDASPYDVIARKVIAPPPAEPSTRRRKTFKALATWLGFIGAHNFYAARVWQGTLELAVFAASAAVLGSIMFLSLGAGDQWPFFVAPIALAGFVGTGLVAIVENISVERDGEGRVFLP